MSVLCGKLVTGCDCDSKPNAGGTVSIQIFNLHDSQTGDVADAESLSFSVFQYDSELQGGGRCCCRCQRGNDKRRRWSALRHD